MPNRFEFGGVDLTAGEKPSAARPSSETPFCIAILGDFSGRSSRGVVAKSIGERRALLIDRDNFDAVLSSLRVELHLATDEQVPIVFRFSELEDFHPDRLFEHAAFGKLRRLRERLKDPSTFREVAAELGLPPASPQSPELQKAETAPAKPPSAVQLASGSLLEDLIEQTEARISSEKPTHKRDEIHEFAQQIAAKYAVSAPDPRGPELVAAVDRAVSDVMRRILHHPDFQALEAIWRATFLLVGQLETGERLKLYLFDISKAELAADLESSPELRNTGLFRLLVEEGVLTPGADPWAILVGDYRFGPGKEDVEVLARLSQLAHRARASFLAEGSSSLLGAASLATAPHPREWKRTGEKSNWDEFRRLPAAESVGLALPRFLLRLPYGEKTSPAESFDFEEFSGPAPHEAYLWGNPAFAVALLLAESFGEAGWEMQPGTVSQLDKLPLHIYTSGGVPESKPCAEVLLTEDAVDRILEEGLMPLVSYRGRDSVRVARLQSIAAPPAPLLGRWTR